MNGFCNFNLIQIKYKINYIKIHTHCFSTIRSFILFTIRSFSAILYGNRRNFYISLLINFMRMKQLFTYVNKIEKETLKIIVSKQISQKSRWQNLLFVLQITQF